MKGISMNNRKTRFAWAMVICAAPAWAFAQNASEVTTLSIGFAKAGFTRLEVERRYAEYYNSLEKCAKVRFTNTLGVPVSISGPDLLSDEELNDKLASGKLSVALLPTGLTATATRAGLGTPIAVRGKAATGTFDGYKLLLITRADSPFKSPRDLIGQKIAHTSAGSFSGNLAPRALFPALGLIPEQNYQVEFSKGHERAIMGTYYGFWQAAAIASDVLKRMAENNEVRASDFRVLWQSQTFPVEAWFLSKNLSQPVQTRIKECTYKYRLSSSASRALNGMDSFVPVDFERDYAPVRFVLEGRARQGAAVARPQ
jgi:phosphonate transport system substrate-binding protein